MELEENGERLQLFLLPYFDTAQARDFLGDDSLRGGGPPAPKPCWSVCCPCSSPERDTCWYPHCFAAGSQVSDSETTLFVGGSGQVPTSAFDPL